MAAEAIPVQVACRVLDVSVSGYYDWRSRPPSARAIRHAWLTDRIVEVHQHARGIFSKSNRGFQRPPTGRIRVSPESKSTPRKPILVIP